MIYYTYIIYLSRFPSISLLARSNSLHPIHHHGATPSTKSTATVCGLRGLSSSAVGHGVGPHAGVIATATSSWRGAVRTTTAAQWRRSLEMGEETWSEKKRIHKDELVYGWCIVNINEYNIIY